MPSSRSSACATSPRSATVVSLPRPRSRWARSQNATARRAAKLEPQARAAYKRIAGKPWKSFEKRLAEQPPEPPRQPDTNADEATPEQAPVDG